MYSAIAKNKRNTVLILAFFLLIITGLGWLASAIYGDWSIVVWVVLGSSAYAAFQYWNADKQAVSMAGAVQLQSQADYPRLWRTVENLCIATGSPMPKIYLIDDPAPNAFATGRDPEHAVVAATTGLLQIMDDDELEGVMAHELGHVRNYDIRVSMIVFGLVVAVGFIADMLLRMSFFARGSRENSNPVVMVFGIIAMLVAPLVATMVQLAISRQREYLADATGALTTRHPDALARALQKLADYGRPMRKQNTAMAHLWIADPSRPGMVERLFSTHPPIPDRIARLKQIGGSF
ncbi:MAG TPA: M48 family metalloprotease [Microbacteriaceae bacterium]|nr:M48 family metalloprotease [Microbacteriaceae bacterium]